MVLSFRWLGCRPVTAEIAGSSPVRTAKIKIMIEIKLVELNRGVDYVRYEIIKDGSRFITGWIRFRDIPKLKYRIGGKGHYAFNHNKPHKEVGIKKSYGLGDFYITVEGCEIIKNHIKNMYNFLFRGDA